jgi:hypothetical protein
MRPAPVAAASFFFVDGALRCMRERRVNEVRKKREEKGEKSAP